MSRGILAGALGVTLLCGGVARGEAPPRGEGIGPTLGDGPVALTADERRARATLIRDAAASVGMMNGVLLAGIAQVETGFAHCWSEATWACQGPASASCDGGPVIAGASDGPCSAEQGGLGMFQFDSGTFSDTVGAYGPDIVTVEGNTAAVVPFLVRRAIESIDGVTDEASALAWMNAIPIVDGDPEFERWVYFVSWRYNGCRGCTTQENKYREGTHMLEDELGADFWASPSAPPDPTPDPTPDPDPVTPEGECSPGDLTCEAPIHPSGGCVVAAGADGGDVGLLVFGLAAVVALRARSRRPASRSRSR